MLGNIQTSIIRLLRSKFLIVLGIIVETEVAVKFFILSDDRWRLLPLVILFFAVYVTAVCLRMKRYVGTGLAIVSLLLFHITVQNSGIPADLLHNVTFDTVFSITLTHANPLITLIYGLSMTLLFFLKRSSLLLGSLFVTFMLVTFIYLIKRIMMERDKFHKASITDELTGLYSFSYTLQTGQSSLDTGKAIRVLLIDVDHFKQINDTYGHLTGNKVLVFIADQLAQSAASLSGIVGRLGGDEFIIIVEECPAAAELRNSINRLLDGHKYKLEQEIKMEISMSIGEAVSADRSFSLFEELLHAADMDMYMVKQQMHNMTAAPEYIHILPPRGAEMLDILREKDRYTYTHSLYVAQYAVQFGKQLGLSTEKIEHLRTAGLLHDIGKIMIPNRLLRKPGKLTEEEFDTVKNHVADGLNILSGLQMPAAAFEAIRYHHERWDGNGYPHRAPGRELPLEGRILQLADAFSAMTIKRVYRDRVCLQDAANEIRKQAGKQFDPDLAEQFAAMVLGQADSFRC